MKTLLIMRHAKSSWKDLDLQDHDRPLNKRGRHDAPFMGKLFRNQKISLDLIISSTAVRAETTANLLAKALKYKGEIVLERLVYRATPIDILNLLSKYSDKYNNILLVGHNPTVEGVIEMLTASTGITMATCAVAHITLTIDSWTELTKRQPVIGNLVNLWAPKELAQN
jgi:phosphohistidine phosphatase